jgi:PAS domain S-box-containing protein
MSDYDRMTRPQLLAAVKRLEAHCRELAGMELLKVDLDAQREHIEARHRDLERARTQLETTRDAYADLFDFAPIPYFTLTRSGVIKEANLIACGLLETERARHVGTPLLSYIADADRPRFLEHFRQCRAGVTEVSTELNAKTRSGKPVPVMLNSRPAASGDGDIVRTVMADLTDRKHAEVEIRNINATLEQRVRERTGELVRANETLRHEVLQRQVAEAALQQANQAKDDFLAMLGHELRNPLGTLLQSIELWRGGNLPAERLERVEAIALRQVRHISRLVDDLLDVSRIARGKIVLRKKPTDLGRLAREVVRDLRPGYDMSGLDLQLVEEAETPIWVDVDPDRMSQVLGNLLHNARKFTPRGGHVTVQLERNGSQARFKVTDTGIGIEPANLHRVFNTFFQSDRSLDRTAGGLGLGLALVKGLVDLHGGRVRADSGGADRGSEFCVELALCPSPPAPEAVEPKPAGKRKRGRYRVLVIDDHRDTLHTMYALLDKLGHETVTAETGEEALRAAAEFHPDVILSDIGLPGMDGYTIARRIRTDPSLRPRKLVAVTGYGQPGDQERAYEAGFDQHITKPVGMDDLCRILDELPEP